jgi:hypothetical protein
MIERNGPMHMVVSNGLNNAGRLNLNIAVVVCHQRFSESSGNPFVWQIDITLFRQTICQELPVRIPSQRKQSLILLVLSHVTHVIALSHVINDDR